MTDLSPEALSVWCRFCEVVEDHGPPRLGLAAALRAVADQVVPWKPEPTEESIGPTIDFGYAWALFSQANDTRQELLAIAAELEADND
jgi:hypothetical protein